MIPLCPVCSKKARPFRKEWRHPWRYHNRLTMRENQLMAGSFIEGYRCRDGHYTLIPFQHLDQPFIPLTTEQLIASAPLYHQNRAEEL